MNIIDRFRSLRTKIMVLVLVPVFLGLTILTLLLTTRFGAIQTEIVDQWTTEAAKRSAVEIEFHLNAYAVLARETAENALRLRNLSDEQKKLTIDSMAIVLLQKNPGIRGAYFMFEDRAYFSDERVPEGDVFSTTWFRSGSSIQQSDTTGSIRVGATDEYWWGPKNSGKEYVTDVYKWLYTGERDSVMMVSYSVPILENGRFIGIFGLDISTDDLWDRVISKIAPVDSGYAFLVDNKGARAAYSKKELRGKILGDDMEPAAQKKMLTALRDGESYRVEKLSQATGQLSRVEYTPVHFGVAPKAWSVGSVIPMERVIAPMVRLRYIAVIVCLLVLFVLSIALFMLGNAIVRPISRASAIMGDIAHGEGDLTQRMPENTNDEIGQMARSFNVFAENVRIIISQVQENSRTLASAAEELSSTSRNMSGVANDMSEQTHQVVAAMEQSSTGSGQASSSLNTLSASVNNVSAAVEEMSISIREVETRCREELRVAADAKRRAGDVVGTMDKLDQSAREINRVLDLIEDIAEQINLLALNATIEAATAGEAGKGFAVVAGEVKELAKQTAAAIEKISAQIIDIQKSVGDSVRDIQGISQVIDDVNGISQAIVGAVGEQSSTMTNVAETVSSVNKEAGLISHNVQEISTGLKEVASHAAHLGDAASRTVSNATGTEEAAQSLASLSSDLNQKVGHFKV